LDEDVISGPSGADKPTQTSAYQSGDWDEEPSYSASEDRAPTDVADEDTDMLYGRAGASDGACFVFTLATAETHSFATDSMDSHRAILVHIKNHLQKDRVWQISLKGPEIPVRIPDVLKKYRTVHRIIRELTGKVINDGHTILKVSAFSYMDVAAHDGI
jgi:hypothetical protein